MGKFLNREIQCQDLYLHSILAEGRWVGRKVESFYIFFEIHGPGYGLRFPYLRRLHQDSELLECPTNLVFRS